MLIFINALHPRGLGLKCMFILLRNGTQNIACNVGSLLVVDGASNPQGYVTEVIGPHVTVLTRLHRDRIALLFFETFFLEP